VYNQRTKPGPQKYKDKKAFHNDLFFTFTVFPMIILGLKRVKAGCPSERLYTNMNEKEPDKKKGKEILSWCLYDWAYSSFATIVISAILPVYYSRVAASHLTGNTATVYWGYTTVVALVASVLLAPVMGAIADFSGIKKRLLLTFAAVGIFATALLYYVRAGDWLLASVFFIFGNVGFSMSEVFYNAILPSVAGPEEIDRVSVKGYALGYLGGGVLLALDVVLIELMPDKALATRISFITVSVWWAVFTMPLILNVSEPEIGKAGKLDTGKLTAGFKRLAVTFSELRRYRELFLFLAAFWIYNDGIGTIIKMATIYGAEIGIGERALIGALLMTQFVGIPFSFAFGWLARYLGTKNSIMLGLFVYMVISVSGYFMETAIHFFILAFLVGTVQGGTQALSRSLFGTMLPKDKTAEFFGFYSMSSQLAGVIGPLVFAVVSQATGTSRLSIFSLIFFFITGALILSRVDVEKGMQAACYNSPV
jgi:UMF1 family MFS transporter